MGQPYQRLSTQSGGPIRRDRYTPRGHATPPSPVCPRSWRGRVRPRRRGRNQHRGDEREPPHRLAPTRPTTASSVTIDRYSRRHATVTEERARDLAYLEALVTPELGSGLPAISRSFDIEVADLNGDGHDDIIFASHQNRKVSCGQSGTGSGYGRPMGMSSSFCCRRCRTDTAVRPGDVNGDGATDVYCQLGGFKGSGILKSNELWIQTAPGTFEDQAADWGVDDPSGRGRWPVMFDFDNDGLTRSVRDQRRRSI